MKYIRTKDGIYELEYDLSNIVITKKECPNTELYEKKADTIEELCDGIFMILYQNKKVFKYDISKFPIKEMLDSYYHMKSINEYVKNYYNYWKNIHKVYNEKDENLNATFEMYLYINTDTFPKYVAKMNEKGELELL